jgi:hypothetical protein
MTLILAATPVLMCALIIQAGSAQVDVRSAGTLIDRARELISASATPERSQAGFVALVEALAELSAAVDAPPAFRANVLAARQALRDGRTDDKAAIALRDAHKVLHGGAGVVAASAGGDLAARASATRSRIAAARDLLDKGRVDASARALLEAALLIVTPVEPDE